MLFLVLNYRNFNFSFAKTFNGTNEVDKIVELIKITESLTFIDFIMNPPCFYIKF